MRSSKATGVPRSASSDIAPATWAIRQRRRASSSASAAIDVCACVPLMSVSPSLLASVSGSSPAVRSIRRRGSVLLAAPKRSLADQREREMRQRREVSARAHAALLRNRRKESRVQHAGEQVREVDARARKALGDDVRAQQHHRADFALREQVADTGRVASHEVHLELGEPVRWDRDLRELAEAGRHAVRDGTARHEAIDDGARRRRPLACARRDRHARAIARDRRHLFDRERIAVDDDLVRHGGNVDGPYGQFKGLRMARAPAYATAIRTCPTAPSRDCSRA